MSGRGLRQSDPLSPYLFIICVEGLSSVIHEVKHRNDIRGAIVSCLKDTHCDPCWTHLIFLVVCYYNYSL